MTSYTIAMDIRAYVTRPLLRRRAFTLCPSDVAPFQIGALDLRDLALML